MASIDRTAYPRFKRVVSARELAESFTPTADEADWARGRSQGESNLLALVVLLKCYQRLGYFPKVADVPAAVVGALFPGSRVAPIHPPAALTAAALAPAAEVATGPAARRGSSRKGSR